jgi:murein L,D-transpeptidase YafK
VLGPKRKEGDLQVPEGFYYIERFNPLSIFHLSLGINYPNEADKLKSNAPKLGKDIFIHGECTTVGCLPMTNDKIKEIYLYALAAKENGQTQIPVYLFPFRFSPENKANFYSEYADNQEFLSFWENLQEGYDHFQANLKALRVSVNAKGDYQIAS